ncbi:MAG: hypothetical protein WD555_06435 [Fulvivirga sp.]
MIITEEFIDKGKSIKGGWSKVQLQIIDVSWPPEKGWKEKVIGKDISAGEAEKFLSYKEAKESGHGEQGTLFLL